MKNHTNRVAKYLPRLVSASLALQAVPAISYELEEIIITARKKQESMQDTPVPVTVFTQEDMAKMGLVEFENLEFNNPNVRMSPSGNGGVANTRIAMRGNIQNSSSALADGPVTVYQDGHALAHPLMLDGVMVDVESVQTLRGPQGTLFGRNSTGGAMLFKTVAANPDEGLSGYFTAGAGEFGTARVTAALNLPLGENFALRLVGHHSERDGYAKYTDGSERGDKTVDVARVNMYWSISNNTVLEGFYQKTDVEGTSAPIAGDDPLGPNPGIKTRVDDIPADVLAAGAFPRKVSPSDESKGESDFYGLRLTHDFDATTVKLYAARRDYELFQNVGIAPSLLDFSNPDKPDLQETSFELQLNGSAFDDRLDWVGGLYYYEEDLHEDNRTYLIDAAGGSLAVWTKPDLKSESQSAYLQGTYTLSDRLRLTAGVRYTDDEKAGQGIIDPTGTLSTPFEFSEDNTSYLVTVDWSPTNDIMFYGTVSTGYRAGGTSGGSDGAGNLRAFSPEEVTNYEIGTKGEYLDGTLRLNAAVFRQNYKDYQYFTIRPDPATNIPTRILAQTDVIIPGAELELTWLLPNEFVLQATYGYTDSEVDDRTSEVNGQQLPLIDEYNYSISLSKNISTGIGDFDLLAAYSWRDSFTNEFEVFGPDRNGLDDVEDVGLLNASVTYTVNENWSARLWGTNLTDEEYLNNILYNPTESIGGIYFGFVSPPRIIGMDITFNF